MSRGQGSSDELREGVAVIGMAGRFPGARDVDELWRNLREGVESVTFFSDEDLRRAGLAPELRDHPDWVPAAAVLEGVDRFDAGFFGLSPREATVMDPQQRLFLECAWEALETAGYDPRSHPGLVGVFAGASLNSYGVANLLRRRDLLGALGTLQSILASDKDFLATRVSYALDLRGPSFTVQSACSTSLLAVHCACQSLLEGECDLALAGGVSVNVSQGSGYLYERGGIRSPDGRCRAFDARAEGGIGGNGLGIVVLKRLGEALEDRDRILAVVRGSAVNNDGARKAGFSAPSVAAQEEVVAEALAVAGVEPRSVTYVECHGTGTPLGDPIEVQALTRAFRRGTTERGFCAVGSVKPNVGHLDAAAGVAGLIKAVLCLQHQELPPSLNFDEPNPAAGFDASPFFVNASLRPWGPGPYPRRAGVTSLGMGGTNVHVILEEAPCPEPAPSPPERPCQLLVLSARSEAALEESTRRLAGYLERSPEARLADVAHTLQVGRRRFEHRRMAVCRDPGDAVAVLTLGEDPERSATRRSEAFDTGVAFLFPGQGSQYVGMGRGLLASEPAFTEELRRCAKTLRPELGLDLLEVLYPAPGEEAAAARLLHQTRVTQPALFAVEYSLARLWMSWGVRPEVLAGHSLGEYVAACLAGVMEPEAALRLVSLRGRLMDAAAPGAMLAVALPEEDLGGRLGPGLSLAAVNAPGQCVASGPADGIEALERTLAAEGVECRRLRTAHAFHSAAMDPVVERFAEEVGQVELRAPRLPFYSDVTGEAIRAEEAVDPSYWAAQLRRPVLFSRAAAGLLADPGRPLVEVGPGRILGSLVRVQPAWTSEHTLVQSLRHPKEDLPDLELLLASLGRLWLAGCRIDAPGFWRGARPRVALPTYPFERERHWADPPEGEASGAWWPTTDGAPSAPSGRERGGEGAPAPAAGVRSPSAAEPRDAVERDLAEVWRSLLGVERPGIRDNFFQQGGHSLLAVRLMSEVHRRWGIELPHSILFRGGTIEHLARLVRTRGEGTDRSPLVSIQADGTRPPFFAVHPASGNVLCYLELSRRLGDGQPFYGLEAADVFRTDPGGDEADGEYFRLDVEELATRYVRAVALAQPRGPYFLGGWSFGGVIAFEMARQLDAAGERVALLALLDAPAPFPRPADFSFARTVSGAAREIGRFFGKDLVVPYHELRGLDRAAQLDAVLEHACRGGVVPPNVGLAQVRRFVNFIGESLEAVWRYAPLPYSGRITLLRARDLARENHLLAGHPDYAEADYGWSRLSSEPVEVRTMPGNHFTMPFPPQVDVLARELGSLLEQSRREALTLAPHPDLRAGSEEAGP